ncbi:MULTISPECIES: hypothetical protein [unclassified Acinetobacter]|uniref:hypothetical protein n=1 Tax=unclassified Acinetobacter TaxID=196816 RepID=UPI0035B9F8E5
MQKSSKALILLPICLILSACHDLPKLMIAEQKVQNDGLYLALNYDIEEKLKQENISAPRHGLHFYCATNEQSFKDFAYPDLISFDVSKANIASTQPNLPIIYFAQANIQDLPKWQTRPLYCRYHLADLGYLNFVSNMIILR